MPHRDFDAARAERLRGTDPVTFTIGGETFTCVPSPCVGDALALADAPERGDNPSEALRAIIGFVRALLRPADRRRWDRTIRRQKASRLRRGQPVSSEEIWEVALWLTAEHSARPTRPPTGSSGGRPPSGDSSNRSSSTTPAETSTPSG